MKTLKNKYIDKKMVISNNYNLLTSLKSLNQSMILANVEKITHLIMIAIHTPVASGFTNTDQSISSYVS